MAFRRPHFDKTNKEPASRVFRFLAHLVRNMVPFIARTSWSGGEHIPREGGAIVVANHISNFDPIALGEFLIWQGRWPRFLGKADIWKVPVLGWVARKCGQIPVYRGTDRAGESLVHAREALEAGNLVAIYPEGTITADPDGWPMSGRRGAAQLALTTGAPVIPVVQSGADQVLGGKKIEVRRLFGRRKDITIVAGPPIDLSRFAGQEPTRELLDSVTTLLLDTLTSMRATLIGEPAPEGRYDLRQGRRLPITGRDQ